MCGDCAVTVLWLIGACDLIVCPIHVFRYGRSLATCNNDGPIFAMRNSTLATLTFSTMDHFASQVVNTIGDGFGVNAMGVAVPDGTTMSTVLLARPGVNRAARAWGTPIPFWAVDPPPASPAATAAAVCSPLSCIAIDPFFLLLLPPPPNPRGLR